jgi:hypothetical protein
MREKISTLDCPGIRIGERRCGNTTRQIDFAIQELFNGKIVFVRDHYGSNKEQNGHIMRRLIDRLLNDHNYTSKGLESDFIIDKDNFTIELK